MRDYDALTRVELEARLAAAEDVCLLFGWTVAHMDTDREKAAHELWRHWRSLVPPDETDPRLHPHLSDEAIFALATQRDLIRHTTMRRLTGGI